MALSPGARLGVYEIQGLLGAGGMGEVYKARDTRLDRSVAIKVLPASLASDRQFRERFDREARTISQLDHPHICALHDVGEHEGTAFLVMQYLEGETLESRLKKGAMPLDEALQIAVQVAAALDKAHTAGIVHRDLKPGNIMLTRSGARLLDFGLAKTSPVVANSALSMLPTTPPSLTQQGTIIGTFQYMAPEQLEGLEADARTDIFAFGAVLYEMVSGRKAFTGRTQVSLLSAILKDEPPAMQTIERVVPAALDFVVRKCLAKNRDARWQSARDLGTQLEWIAQGGAVSAPLAAAASGRQSRLRQRVVWTAVVFALAAAATGGTYFGMKLTPPAAPVRFQVQSPPGTIFQSDVGTALQPPSPDGRRIALTIGNSGQNILALRSLDTLEVRVLPGTEGAAAPFWSPDSRSVGFFAQGRLKRIDIFGGPPQVVATATSFPSYGATWGPDGTIVFVSAGNGGLSRVSATGGAVTPVTVVDKTQNEIWHRWPSFLPDGRHFLYVAGPSSVLFVGSLDSGEHTRLVATESKGVYSSGYLLFTRANTLLAQPFDASARRTIGDAVPFAENVQSNPQTTGAIFDASPAGVLTFRTGASAVNGKLVWYSRSGMSAGDLTGVGDYRGIELSPDDRRLGTHVHVDPGGGDVFMVDAVKGAASRFTFDPERHYTRLVWSPDGSRVAYSATAGKYGIYVKSSSGAGAEELLVEGDGPNTGPLAWSKDGKLLLYERANQSTGRDVWAIQIAPPRKPFAVLNTEYDEDHAAFSPDGRWILYQSNASGRPEVYVQSFPPSGGKWQISTGGGGQPRWRQDGKEIYFLGPDRKLMAVEVRASTTTFETGQPVTLFDTRAAINGGLATIFSPFDVAANGQRFIVSVAAREVEVTPVTVVMNWTAALKK